MINGHAPHRSERRWGTWEDFWGMVTISLNNQLDQLNHADPHHSCERLSIRSSKREGGEEDRGGMEGKWREGVEEEEDRTSIIVFPQRSSRDFV
jgi:hypothetical protein